MRHTGSKRQGQGDQNERVRLDRERLNELALFASVGDSDLGALLEVAAWRVYRRGEHILRPGHGRDVECIVVEGRVRLLRSSETGRVLTERELGPGSVFDFGRLPGMTGDELFAEPTTEATICTVPWPIFLRTIASDQIGTERLIEQLRAERQELGDFAADVVLSDVSTRIRHVLRSLALSDPGHAVSLSVEELAGRAGVPKEQVSRVVADLQRHGLAWRQGRRRILIPDPDRLR